MYPEVGNEANLGKDASPSGRVEVGRRCAVGAAGPGLACCTVLLSLNGPALLSCVGSFENEMALEGSIRSQ